MFWIDRTLSTPQENLAFDEALLDAAEAGETGEVLRFWEPKSYAVVVGYANKVALEVNLGFCRHESIPVLRRCTGGGTVLQGPGVLNYTLILRIAKEGPTHSITSTNHFVMNRQREVVANLLGLDVQIRGHTDLAVEELKFSGNAQRRKRGFLIFHGSFLLEMNLPLIEKTLLMPSNQPEYRLGRSHTHFLRNLHCQSTDLRKALRGSWSATIHLPKFPEQRFAHLVAEKYSLDAWNLKF